MTKEALKLALEALEYHTAQTRPIEQTNEAITAIKEALANEALEKMAENARELGRDYEPAQKPCGNCKGSGWVTRDPDIGTDQECFVCGGSGAYPKEPEQEPVAWMNQLDENFFSKQKDTFTYSIPLYTGPQRTWVGLTDEDFLEACQIAERGNYLVAFQRIQAKLKEKNT